MLPILGLFFKSVVIVGIFLKATAFGDMPETAELQRRGNSKVGATVKLLLLA